MGFVSNKSKSSNHSFYSVYKQNHVFIKFAVCFLLTGLVFRFFSPISVHFLPAVGTDTVPFAGNETTLPPPATKSQFSSDIPANQSLTSKDVTGKCDLSKGEWVPDPSAPLYTNDSCHWIEGHQDCIKNGRPDAEYLHWRWVPRGCDLPKFNPQRFLALMRSKSWAFIGDSISRNHAQSLLCILSQVEQPALVYHDKQHRSKTWHFKSHNFTLAIIWAPFLAKAAIFEDDNGVSTATARLHLDKPDPAWADQFNSIDYVLIAGGKWFLKDAIYYERSRVVGCHNCPPGKNLTGLGFDYAYQRVLRLCFNFITRMDHKASVFFRTITPDHFENGEWDSGGYCNKTEPFKDGMVNMTDLDARMHSIELEEFEKARDKGSKIGMSLKLLDTTNLSLLRRDGHPGVYRQFRPFLEDKNAKVQNDCLHWCLPGPIDSWNDLIMELLANS